MQLALIHETIHDAIREAIQTLGGFKKVGAMLWPENGVEHAAGHLRDCLNPERRERLTPEQVDLIGRMAREAGCHAIATYFCRSWGYADPVPIQPEDEVARMQREFIEATQRLAELAARIEKTQARASLRVA
jgi:sugar phosphate isomerase/epimerase